MAIAKSIREGARSMALVQTELTPDLAAQLLASQHPRQRKVGRRGGVVALYARAIREGRWRLTYDAILVVGETHAGPDDPLGSMFNGARRCSAVIETRRSIPVYIDWDADPSTFDVIDTPDKRTAQQFVMQNYATARAAASRVCLWYKRRFDRAPVGTALVFDMHEVLEETARRTELFDAALPEAVLTYQYTGLSIGVCLAAYSIAMEYDYDSDVSQFVAGVVEPASVEPGSPSRLLSDRFRKQSHRSRRRTMAEDWTLLVRALNLHLQGRTATKLVLGECWPMVAETEADFNRRRDALRRARARSIDARQSDRRTA